MERIQTLPVLLLITFRPDFATNYPHMTSLTEYPLGAHRVQLRRQR